MQEVAARAAAARGRHVADRPRSLRVRLVRALAVVAAALLVAGIAGTAVVYRQLDSNIASQDISGLLGEDRPDRREPAPGEGEPPLNILLIGSDTRDFEGGDSFGGTAATPGLSDTTILLHLAADRTSATLVSLPRDLLVEVPACELPDGTTTEADRMQFNRAYAVGGPACTVRTVEAVTGVFVDHFVVVDFLGFERMVDAVGGVEVCLPEPVRDREAGLELPAGRQVVQGEQALAYVRARKSFGDGSDTGRIERQQAFLSSMVQKVTSTGVLLRPDRLVGLLDAATESITTDPGLASLNALREVAMGVRGLPPEEIRFVTAPVTTAPSDENRLVLAPAAQELWEALRTDSPLPGSEPTPAPSASATSGPPLSVSPDGVQAQVANAGAAEGAASTAAEALRVQGFAVAGVTNSEEVLAGAVVRHGTGQEEAARTLAAAFPGAAVELDPSLGDVVQVLLGEGAPAAVEVRNRLPGPPLPTPDAVAPSGAPTTITARAASEDVCG